MIFDPHMNFCLHYESVLNKVVSRLKYLRGIKRFLSTHVMKINRSRRIYSRGETSVPTVINVVMFEMFCQHLENVL
jgi:hypothetical protein